MNVNARHDRGVTLIELVVLLTAFGVLAAAFSSAFMQASRSLPISLSVIKANGLAQSCAEHILATRRLFVDGYDKVNQDICQILPELKGYHRRVKIASVEASKSGCPISARCKKVQVLVASTEAKKPYASLVFMLVGRP